MDISLSANVALSASLQAQLAPVLTLGLLLSTAGGHLYRMADRVDRIGGDLSAALPPPGGGDDAHTLMLLTTVPAAWTALQGIAETT